MRPTYSGYKRAQRHFELERLQAIAKQCHSYLEIGCRHGDTLLDVGFAMPIGSTVVAIDLPGGPWGLKGTEQTLLLAVAQLRAKGYNAYAIIGNSRSESVLASAKSLGPFDLIFIDGDHSYAGVTGDWTLYHTLGRVIALHDVNAITDVKAKARNEVPKFWAELKIRYPDAWEEFIDASNPGMGIGVITRGRG
jgi:hypothetical protein